MAREIQPNPDQRSTAARRRRFRRAADGDPNKTYGPTPIRRAPYDPKDPYTFRPRPPRLLYGAPVPPDRRRRKS